MLAASQSSAAQLVDQVEALLLALEHHVLARAAAQDALQHEHRGLLLLLLRQHVLLHARRLRALEDRADHLLAAVLLALVHVCASRLLGDLPHRLVQRDLDRVLALRGLLARRLDLDLERGRRQCALELEQARVRAQIRRLHLDPRCLRVRDVAVAPQRGVDRAREVGVLGDDVALAGLAVAVRRGLLARLEHLPQHLHALPLRRREDTVALLLLQSADARDLVDVALLALVIAHRERLDEQLEPLLLEVLDLLLPVAPLAELLLLHEVRPQQVPELVRRRGQHGVEDALLPRALNHLDLEPGYRQPPRTLR